MKDLYLEIETINCICSNEKKYYKRVLKNKQDSNMEKYTLAANNHVDKYKDFIVNNEKEDLYVYSKLRGVTFVIKNLIFKLKEQVDDANQDWDYLFELINQADADYNIENTDEIDSERYIDLIQKYYSEDVDEEEERVMVLSKQEAKKLAKASVKFKYKIGDKYALRYKTVKGDVQGEEVYEVKKFIYTIGPNIVNSVIMKQISGKPCSRKQLNHFDCLTFHLKYEPGLYVFSMATSFFKLPKEWKDPKKLTNEEKWHQERFQQEFLEPKS